MNRVLEITEAGAFERDMTEEEIAAIPPPPPPVPRKMEVTKLRLVESLAALDKLRAAYALLKLEAPLADLTDAELVLRERWQAAYSLDLLAPEVKPFLFALGLNAESLFDTPDAAPTVDAKP